MLKYLLLAVVLSPLCAAAGITERDAVRAIVGEAANQGRHGMTAVAAAIRNRGTLSGVFGYRSSMPDSQPKWVWDMARAAWRASAKSDPSNGGTHWESIDFKVPYWTKGMRVTARVGKHVFYAPRPKA